MNFHRALSLALAAFVVSAVASCAGDGGSPTSSGTNASAGNQTRPNGTQLVLASGGNQTGVAGRPLPDPVAVRVLDATSRPISGATVNFIAKDGSADPAQASTDAEGYARTTWTLGTAAGTQELRLSGTGGTTLVVGAMAVAPAKVTRVQVIPDSLALSRGATGDFSAVAYDSTGNVLTGRTITWTSSDSVTAAVSSTGTVTAVSPGAATVTATVEGVGGSAKVIVSSPPPATVARVVVSPDSAVLQPGHTADLDAAAYDAGGHVLTGRAVTWTTLDSTIARVGADGMVTAVAAGTAQVTATVEGVRGSAKVIVVAPPPAAVARVAVIPDSLVLDVGGRGDFNAVAYDAEGHVLTGRAVTWTSSDSTVAAVGAGGAVTARSAGSARVSATVEGVSGSAVVIVHTSVPAIVRVEVVPDSQVVVIGQTAGFSAFAYDATNHIVSGLAVTWSISEPTVARIGQYGLVTALAVGTARVTATVEGVSGSATVRVIEQPVGSASAPTSTTPDLRAGYDYVCRLRSGIIQCYGDDDEGQPIGEHHAASGSFVQLTAGQTHACGLRGDGVVECFGSNQYGEAPAQKRAATGSFTQVSAGLNHSCAIRGDGAMECWGNDSHGEAPPLWIAQSGRFVVVTANANRTCALRNDGVGECRGFRLGDPSIRILPGGWYVMLGTSTGTSFCLQRNTGEEECWGDQQVSLGSGPFVDLTVGGNQVCVLRPDGHASCAGYAPTWQGPGERSVTGPDEGSVTPRTWARLTAGTYHTCGLRRDGYFECFGLQTIGSDAPDVVPSADTPQSVLGGGSVRVSWRDINSNELRTEIDRSVADADGNPTTWARAGVLGASTTGFTDGQATPGAIYVYRIRVCNNAGCSGWAQSNPTRYPAA